MMRFTVNNKKVAQPTPAPAPAFAPVSQGGIGSMFKNMMNGKYKSKGCSACSGAR